MLPPPVQSLGSGDIKGLKIKLEVSITYKIVLGRSRVCSNFTTKLEVCVWPN